MQPFFSIVIPTYNRAHIIGETVKSVINQTFSDWELIVIDDGSTDKTRQVVEGIEDARVHYVYQENAERSAARNNGINHSKGQYICFLDSDDEFLSDHLAEFRKRIEEEKTPVGMLYTMIIKDYGDRQEKLVVAHNDNPFQAIVIDFRPTPSCVCIHRDILQKHQFRLGFEIVEDFNLWAEIVLEYPLFRIDKYTVVYNRNDENSTTFNLKYLQAMELGWGYILSYPPYHPHIPAGFKKNMLSDIYLGLADVYAGSKSTGKMFSYLRKTFFLRPASLFSRQFWGILKKGVI